MTRGEDHLAGGARLEAEDGTEVRGCFELPRIPASAAALLHDERGRLLVLKPTYKRGWTLPGGQMEGDGETPWEACQREVHEECGIEIASGKLVCVDFLRPRPAHAGGLRLVFDAGVLSESECARIVLQESEIAEHRFVFHEQGLDLLSGPVRRRVAHALNAPPACYLENGASIDP